MAECRPELDSIRENECGKRLQVGTGGWDGMGWDGMEQGAPIR